MCCQAPNQRKRQLQPCSHCWSSKGEIYVGCSNGQLFKVDVETGQVTVLLSDEHGNDMIWTNFWKSWLYFEQF